jgi:hypothetical protein
MRIFMLKYLKGLGFMSREYLPASDTGYILLVLILPVLHHAH